MIRLDKYLTECGIGTRNDVKKIIRQGQITVNGQVIKGADYKVDTQNDIICKNGKEISYEKYSYYIFHKPAGCITANTDDNHKTIMDYLPKEISRKCSAVGRLDKDTEGLLLLTNDGGLSHKLRSPAHHVPKTYYVKVDSLLPKTAIEAFQNGIDIGDDKPTKPAVLEILTDYTANITITEGRYHQVKRMFHAIGCEVIYLKRLSMGNIGLNDLKIGEYRKLTDEEVELLKNS